MCTKEEFTDSLADHHVPIEQLHLFHFHDIATISRLHTLREIWVISCDMKTAIDFIQNIP